MKKYFWLLGMMMGGLSSIATVLSPQQELGGAKDYVMKALVPKPHDSYNSFQERYGDPEKAEFVLVIYTSLTCPMCADWHTLILPKLLEAVKQGTLAIVVREYPADPLSLRMAAVAWAVPGKASTVRHHLFAEQEQWIRFTEPNQFESYILEIANKVCTIPGEKEAIQKELAAVFPLTPPTELKKPSSTELMKNIFNHRLKDKEALAIDAVPTVWLLSKRTQRLHPLPNPLNDRKIFEIIEQEKRTSQS